MGAAMHFAAVNPTLLTIF